jgi:hypothetical protein
MTDVVAQLHALVGTALAAGRMDDWSRSAASTSPAGAPDPGV